MELKEGIYVRTKDGYIRKCVTVDLEDIDSYELDDFIPNEFGDYINWLNENELKTYISKIRDNIIDLIEVGDYVNGVKITRVIPQDICGDEVLDYQHIFTNDKEIFEYEIKSIVTKEMYESICYKVEE